MVTGTDADLRCLPMRFVHRKLKEHGSTEEALAKLERWDKIDQLRDIANRQSEDQRDPELAKFSRQIRMTTTMQKQKYQNDINKLLDLLIKNLDKSSYDEYGNFFEKFENL